MKITWKFLSTGVLLALFLAALFALLAIYDSDKMPFMWRFIFWFMTIGSGLVAALIALPLVTKEPLRAWSVPLRLCILSAFACIPVPIILLGFDTGFQSGWPAMNWLRQYFMSFVLALIILAGTYITLRAFGVLNDDEPSAPQKNSSHAKSLLKRLPAGFSDAEIFAVSAEDHYLRVHTDLGETLILMRLIDALDALTSVEGMQTHRSWWVAINGVQKITSDGAKQFLVLKSGVSVPIARSRLKAVRDAFA